MKQSPPIPRLIQIIAGSNAAGDAAGQAFRSASSRLLSWSAAFDQWLAELRENYRPSVHSQALLAWQRLMRGQEKMPWELGAEDIQEHLAAMEARGYAANTIAPDAGYLAGFYRWCAERQVDPLCPRGFNPAQGISHPQSKYFEDAQLLSHAEMQALVEVLSRDRSPLGRRHYAFFLTRLHTGALLQTLLRLSWGQIEHDEAGAWLRWRAEAERAPLAGEAWQAIQEWLRASGRLAGIRPDDRIFAPMADGLAKGSGDRPEDWVEGRILSRDVALRALKAAGREAGIAAGKLTLNGLRLTAIRLRLEAGDSPQ